MPSDGINLNPGHDSDGSSDYLSGEFLPWSEPKEVVEKPSHEDDHCGGKQASNRIEMAQNQMACLKWGKKQNRKRTQVGNEDWNPAYPGDRSFVEFSDLVRLIDKA
jgi:hypothetical protein